MAMDGGGGSGGGGVHPVHALEEGGALGDLAEGLVGEADQVVGPRPSHGPHHGAHHVHPDGPVLPAHQRRAHAPGRVHRRARDGPVSTTQQHRSVNKSFCLFLVLVFVLFHHRKVESQPVIRKEKSGTSTSSFPNLISLKLLLLITSKKYCTSSSKKSLIVN